MVLRVDKEKGYIDLSKRRVAAEDVAACEDRWNKSKMVHSIMRHLAEITGQELEVLYKAIGWPLYKAYGHAFEAFKVARDAVSPLKFALSAHRMQSFRAYFCSCTKSHLCKHMDDVAAWTLAPCIGALHIGLKLSRRTDPALGACSTWCKIQTLSSRSSRTTSTAERRSQSSRPSCENTLCATCVDE